MPSRLTIYTETITRYCIYKNTDVHIYRPTQVQTYTSHEQKDNIHKQGTVEYANKHVNKSQTHTDTYAL